jgi:leader peptidase (prepilin peptidase)/N-methyltransferase
MESSYFAIVSILMGLVVGSFLNVVISRLPSGESVVRPRSRCPRCRKTIAWHDNIPVLSWLVLRGRCRSCGKPIPVIYPVVELLTAFLFLAATLKFGWSPLLCVRDWPFLALLVAITFIDLRHRIIPDELSLGGLVLGLATSWWSPEPGLLQSAFGAALGFAIFFAFAWGYQALAKRSGLGGGDIKLLAMLGAFLGPMGVVTTIVLSSVIGSVAGLAWAMAARKRDFMSFAIPYGPFLVLGALYYYLLGDILWLPFTIPT